MIYDLIVIGAGPAGYLAAERASHEGLTVLLAEKKFIGGVCLNEGCIPSKTLLNSSKIYDYARLSEKYGVKSEKVTFDHLVVVKRKNKVVKTLVGGVKAKLKNNGVEIVDGYAKVTGKKDKSYEISVGENKYLGKNLLIATGSQPIMPPIPGLRENYEKKFVVTNREIFDIEKIPEALVIIGGGVIGLEMASYFNSVGSKVTVIEMLSQIAGKTDPEIASILQKNYEKKGVKFELNSRVIEVKEGSVAFIANDKTEEVKADLILASMGRKPEVSNIGLESIGVDISNGRINTDEQLRTNVVNVFAAGDVNGKSMLAHTAYREADVCVNTILGKKDRMRYTAVPSVIYTHPEVASAGETEQSALEKGIDIKTVNISMKYSGRYVAENEGGNGICKIVVDKELNTILGIHMIGSYCSEMIFGATMMIENQFRIEDVKQIIFPHPTVGEVIREGIFEF